MIIAGDLNYEEAETLTTIFVGFYIKDLLEIDREVKKLRAGIESMPSKMRKEMEGAKDENKSRI